MPSKPDRLQIATKIHFFLLRELGQGIHVERMLSHPAYARDVLLVCDACKGSPLARLAAQFRQAPAGPEATTAPAPSRRAGARDWGTDSAGFGLSRPLLPPTAGDPARPAPGWLDRWRQR